MSRLNSLARTTSVRSSRPRSSRSRISCAIGRSISRFIRSTVAWPFSCVSQCTNGMYSVVTSTNRAPASTSRRASRQPRPNRPVLYWSKTCFLFQRQIERLLVLRAQQPVGGIERAEHRLLLVVARVLGLRACGNQLLVKTVAILKSAGVHSLGRPHGQRRIFRETAD